MNVAEFLDGIEAELQGKPPARRLRDIGVRRLDAERLLYQQLADRMKQVSDAVHDVL